MKTVSSVDGVGQKKLLVKEIFLSPIFLSLFYFFFLFIFLNEYCFNIVFNCFLKLVNKTEH